MNARYRIDRGDAVTWLRGLSDASVDLVITDPPYESLEKHRAVGTTTRLKHSKASSNDWFAIFPNTRFEELFGEIWRVLRDDTHFYLLCDAETMFVAKPIAERTGFKFWKPLVWDKCLGADTLVWTERGTIRIGDVQEGDRVATPEGGSTTIRAVRKTRAPALRLTLSDGTSLIASCEHRFVRADGTHVEAQHLKVNDALCTRPVRQRVAQTLDLDTIIPDDVAVYELPTTECLWCGRAFDGPRATAAHQARWCDDARSKGAMAHELGIAPKRLRRWIGRGRIPRLWAKRLGIDDLGRRVRCYLQNDSEVWYPRSIPLDHELGKFIGLFAAEGSYAQVGVAFAFHRDEKHLHSLIARFARSIGVRARLHDSSEQGIVVNVSFRIISYLIEHFMGGTGARTKYLKPVVYAAPGEFRSGLLEGLLEGDGHWSHDEQRQTFTSVSPDLTMFALRELTLRHLAPRIRRVENEYGGAWVLTYDPIRRNQSITIAEIESIGEHDLIDVSVTDRDELFLLANGVVTHNCRIGMGYHYRARYEFILFFEKGKRKLANLGTADIIDAPRVHNGYPAEKPVAVSEVLVSQSSEPGEVVVDPFMGSGSAGVAAVRNGRHFWGNDLCAEAVAIAEARLKEAGAEPDLERCGPHDAGAQLGLAIGK